MPTHPTLVSHSRENQDLFVVSLFDQKRKGTYVEIGGATPIQDNTSYLLETAFEWRGFSIEWDAHLHAQWAAHRSNPCLCVDATTAEYQQLFAEHQLPRVIDFLQLDVDPAHNTLKVLQRLPLDEYQFSFVTFEHDLYRGGHVEREVSRSIFRDHGYILVVGDVMHGGLIFEDWYVHPDSIPTSRWQKFQGHNVNMNSLHMTPDLRDLLINWTS